jgi:biotin carboxylase
MYSKLKGKKLLVIGSDASNNSIILAAREMGVYTIVTDGIADRTRTPAKNISDEAWDIDYSDIKALSEKCREAGVSGVFAGYSEFRVLAACRLANALRLPFYANEEQIDLTRNKRTFKDE